MMQSARQVRLFLIVPEDRTCVVHSLGWGWGVGFGGEFARGWAHETDDSVNGTRPIEIIQTRVPLENLLLNPKREPFVYRIHGSFSCASGALWLIHLRGISLKDVDLCISKSMVTKKKKKLQSRSLSGEAPAGKIRLAGETVAVLKTVISSLRRTSQNRHCKFALRGRGWNYFHLVKSPLPEKIPLEKKTGSSFWSKKRKQTRNVFTSEGR